jgi:hypothetical protein
MRAIGWNPVDCLADVLIRVQSHAAARIDELLPHNWTTRERRHFLSDRR